jgi:oxygen-independent coproporphyrinogen III oxidase
VPPRHLYVHVPFCARRCAYCDFAIAVRATVPVERYVHALRRELALRAAPAAGWTLDTLYLGGGTPSRLGGEGVAAVLAAVREHAVLTPGAEVTVEVNPDDVTEQAVVAWVAAGVNRVSLGVQSFSDEALRWMRRVHDAAGAHRAVRLLRSGGVANLSVDLIFALPDAVRRSWRDDVDRIVALAPEHVSLYGLTVEGGTPLGRWVERGESHEAPEERYEAEFLYAHDAMAAAGLEHYEVSNFGRRGFHSRHNSAYWSGAQYEAAGPSAHAFDGRRRSWNVPAYAEWLARLESGSDPRGGAEELTAENRVAEGVYLGLRTSAGLELQAAERPVVAPWLAAGWGRLEDGRLRLTPTGWLRLDSLAAALTAHRSC